MIAIFRIPKPSVTKFSFVFRHDPSSEVANGYEKYLRQCDLIDGAQRPAGEKS
jgi:hypothetical protein